MTTVEQCSKCGTVKPGHPISWDTEATGYVDREAGDFHCFECERDTDKQLKKAKRERDGADVVDIEPADDSLITDDDVVEQ